MSDTPLNIQEAALILNALYAKRMYFDFSDDQKTLRLASDQDSNSPLITLYVRAIQPFMKNPDAELTVTRSKDEISKNYRIPSNAIDVEMLAEHVQFLRHQAFKKRGEVIAR